MGPFLAKCRFRVTAFLLVCLLAPIVAQAELVGKVVGVLDGDTIDVQHGGTRDRIRLNGIDTPEKGQDFGRRAKEFSDDLVSGRDVRVETAGIDKYGRTIGDVFLSDGTHLNKELVRAGLAWWYCRHSSNQELKQLEIEAREAKRGLWKDPVPIPPWVYRKLQRKQVLDIADFECPGDSGSHAVTDQAGVPLSSPIVGNRKSHVYHKVDCPGFGKVSPKNRVTFPSEEEAESAGYRKAGNCPGVE